MNIVEQVFLLHVSSLVIPSDAIRIDLPLIDVLRNVIFSSPKNINDINRSELARHIHHCYIEINSKQGVCVRIYDHIRYCLHAQKRPQFCNK